MTTFQNTRFKSVRSKEMSSSPKYVLIGRESPNEKIMMACPERPTIEEIRNRLMANPEFEREIQNKEAFIQRVIEAWNGTDSIQEAADQLGFSRKFTIGLVRRLRLKGHYFKRYLKGGLENE